MAVKSKATVMKNVLKKLSAVRVTMSPEEQEVLDSIVVTHVGEEQVVGHAMKAKVASKVASRVSSRVASAKPVDDEVEAHAMREKVQSKVAAAKPEVDEVVAHQMKSKVAAKKQAVGAVYFDVETGEYKVQS